MAMMLVFVTSKRLFIDCTRGFWADSESGMASATATEAKSAHLVMVGICSEGWVLRSRLSPRQPKQQPNTCIYCFQWLEGAPIFTRTVDPTIGVES